ncbi:MAG: hypothetical protein M1829_004248 [Trizodia sp. TS-e1964]|nr:MAG: hypothetical protein M1829_004248 [Trizodia sp. TS-e1964]
MSAQAMKGPERVPNARKRARKQLQIPNCSLTSDPLQPAERQNRPRDDEIPSSRHSPEPLSKRVRISPASAVEPLRWNTIREARIDYWRENGTWPSEDQENTMDRFRDPTSTIRTKTKDFGSFMCNYKEGVCTQSKERIHTLLEATQPAPKRTLFSDDNLFEKTCKRIKGENETKVIRDIALLIVPSAEILADVGDEHLEILRETTNACWTNAIPFIKPPADSRPYPRPQPDFGVGFKIDAFSRNQRQRLQPFIGDPLKDYSLVAATYNIYLPFLTSEVKCGASSLDIADRQNAHSQSVAMLGLTTLFRLVGREKELHREIIDFSSSHNDRNIRIWGHYPIINGKDITFYQHQIAEFSISKTAGGKGDNRWRAYTFVRNIYDLWVPAHFERICSVIDMIPEDLDFEVSGMPPSEESGLSQVFDDQSLAASLVENDDDVSNTTSSVTTNTSLSHGANQGFSKRARKGRAANKG